MKRLITVIVILIVGSYFLITYPRTSSPIAYDDHTPVTWRVGLAFPSSGFSLFDRSTVGRWSMIADDLRSQLVGHGYKDSNILLEQTDSRVDQVKQIDKLVNEDKVDILVVVPIELTREEVIATDGDPVTPYLRKKYNDVLDASNAANDQSILQNSPYEKITDTSVDENTQKRYSKLVADLNARTLKQALSDAKSKNVYTVGLGSDTLDKFPFDYFFAVPSPEDIANVQAGFAVSHLGLPELGADGNASPPPANWKVENVEVLAADGVRETTRRYFTQLWKRIGPYFRAGYLHSNTGLLNAKTTDGDVYGVAVTEDGDKSAGVMHNWLDKFYKTDDDTHKLSLVFAQSDALSRGVTRACTESGWNSSDERWPLLTGAGAELISVQDIVENKQSMSVAYDSKKLVIGIAQILFDFALEHPVPTKNDQNTTNKQLEEALNPENGTLYFETYELEGGALENTLIARPVTVTNDNIKDFLIDSGYISSQQAGL